MNPARARLLSPEAPDLRAFGGSSFPVYAGRAKGPPWLQTARVLGSHGLAWLLRTATVVSSDWVSAQLTMGHRSHVSRAVRKIAEARTGMAIQVRNLMQPCKD